MLCGRWWHLQHFTGQWENISSMPLYFQGNVTAPRCKRLLGFIPILGNVPHTSSRCNRTSSQRGEFYMMFPLMWCVSVCFRSLGKKTVSELLLELPTHLWIPLQVIPVLFSARPEVNCKFKAAEWRCSWYQNQNHDKLKGQHSYCMSGLIPLIWPLLNKNVLISICVSCAAWGPH